MLLTGISAESPLSIWDNLKYPQDKMCCVELVATLSLRFRNAQILREWESLRLVKIQFHVEWRPSAHIAMQRSYIRVWTRERKLLIVICGNSRSNSNFDNLINSDKRNVHKLFRIFLYFLRILYIDLLSYL